MAHQNVSSDNRRLAEARAETCQCMERTFAGCSVGRAEDGCAEGALLAVSAAAGIQHGRRQLSGVVACVSAVLHCLQTLHKALLLRGAVQRAAVADQLTPAHTNTTSSALL